MGIYKTENFETEIIERFEEEETKEDKIYLLNEIRRLCERLEKNLNY